MALQYYSYLDQAAKDAADRSLGAIGAAKGYAEMLTWLVEPDQVAFLAALHGMGVIEATDPITPATDAGLQQQDLNQGENLYNYLTANEKFQAFFNQARAQAADLEAARLREGELQAGMAALQAVAGDGDAEQAAYDAAQGELTAVAHHIAQLVAAAPAPATGYTWANEVEFRANITAMDVPAAFSFDGNFAEADDLATRQEGPNYVAEFSFAAPGAADPAVKNQRAKIEYTPDTIIASGFPVDPTRADVNPNLLALFLQFKVFQQTSGVQETFTINPPHDHITENEITALKTAAGYTPDQTRDIRVYGSSTATAHRGEPAGAAGVDYTVQGTLEVLQVAGTPQSIRHHVARIEAHVVDGADLEAFQKIAELALSKLRDEPSTNHAAWAAVFSACASPRPGQSDMVYNLLDQEAHLHTRWHQRGDSETLALLKTIVTHSQATTGDAVQTADQVAQGFLAAIGDTRVALTDNDNAKALLNLAVERHARLGDDGFIETVNVLLTKVGRTHDDLKKAFEGALLTTTEVSNKDALLAVYNHGDDAAKFKLLEQAAKSHNGYAVNAILANTTAAVDLAQLQTVFDLVANTHGRVFSGDAEAANLLIFADPNGLLAKLDLVQADAVIPAEQQSSIVHAVKQLELGESQGDNSVTLQVGQKNVAADQIRQLTLAVVRSDDLEPKVQRELLLKLKELPANDDAHRQALIHAEIARIGLVTVPASGSQDSPQLSIGQMRAMFPVLLDRAQRLLDDAAGADDQVRAYSFALTLLQVAETYASKVGSSTPTQRARELRTVVTTATTVMGDHSLHNDQHRHLGSETTHFFQRGGRPSAPGSLQTEVNKVLSDTSKQAAPRT